MVSEEDKRDKNIYQFGLMRGVILMGSFMFILFAIEEIFNLNLIEFIYSMGLFTLLFASYLIIGAQGFKKLKQEVE